MTNEEYQRLKEAEKEHLQAKKKLQEALSTLQRKKRVRDAVNRIAHSAQSALDRASDLIGQLTAETARDEARFEVAMDAQAKDDTPASDDTDVAAFEAERRAARARTLVRQMKQARGASSRTISKSSRRSESSSPNEVSPPATSSDDDLSTSSTDDLPEKTIGRMR